MTQTSQVETVLASQQELPKGRVLIEEKAIDRRILKLANDIDWYCREQGINELHAVTVLTGAAIFSADLVRYIKTPLYLSFIKASSYDGNARAEKIKFDMIDDLPPEIWNGRTILLIEDIFDSGKTITALYDMFKDRGAKCLLSAVLLLKNKKRDEAFPITFTGFNIPDEFVVGFGMDLGGKYRQLKDIIVVEE